MVKKIRLLFARGLEIEFCDRGKAVEQVEELARKGTRFPLVVFGPEGCGKSAWLKQAIEILRDYGFEALYTDLLNREYIVHTGVKDVIEKLSEAVADVIGCTPIKLANLIVLLVKQLIGKWRKKRIALLLDEVFQAIGLDKAEVYVKMLLNIIEYPPESYENVVVIITTSEGLTRSRIGRHLWAEITPMWNMSRRGFEELYEKIPKPKPDFDEVWMCTGGNPRALSLLYQMNWDVESLVNRFVKEKELTSDFISKWRRWLELAVEDPDTLWNPDTPKTLVEELIARNFIVYNMYERDQKLWIDEPPPHKALEIGVGRYVAWQTPLHREAVRKALGEL